MSIPCKTNCACLSNQALCIDANGVGTCYDPTVQECCTTVSGNTHFVCPTGSCCAGNSAGTCCGSNQECVNNISPPICCPEGMSASCNGTCYNPEESQCCSKETCPKDGTCCYDGKCCPSDQICSNLGKCCPKGYFPTSEVNICCLEGQKSCHGTCYDPNTEKCCYYFVDNESGNSTYTFCNTTPCTSGTCDENACPHYDDIICVDENGHGKCLWGHCLS